MAETQIHTHQKVRGEIKMECKHKNLKTEKIKNKDMLNGFHENEVCLDCGVKFLHMKVQIRYILEGIARDKKLKSWENVTAKDLVESNYLKPTPTLEIAKYLIEKNEKYL